MGKKIIILLFGIVHDLIMLPTIILFIPASFLTKKLNQYRKDRFLALSLLKLNSFKLGSVIFYCSSVGEFEQAIPLISRFEKEGKSVNIFFHSKKGFDYCKNTTSYSTYLTPFDLYSVWIFFLNKLKPKTIIINRHEFWLGFVLSSAFLSKLNVINYIVKKSTPIYDKLILLFCDKLFCANKTSKINFKHTYSGDTRVDRIRERYISKEDTIKKYRNTIRKNIAPNKKLILIGNCYSQDFQILLEINKNIHHECLFLVIPARGGINPSLLNNIIEINTWNEIQWNTQNIIVLNSTGRLFELYSIADVAWVGGAFTKGIHNCLEPSFYEIPMISGPNINEQPDALFLINEGSLRIFETSSDFEKLAFGFKSKPQMTTKIQNDYSPTDYIYSQIK